MDREPRPHIPYAAMQAERRGLHSDIAQQLRERYKERVQQRLHHSQQRQLPDYSRQQAGPSCSQDGGQTLEQIRQRAREEWLRMRHGMERADTSEHSLDDNDLSM